MVFRGKRSKTDEARIEFNATLKVDVVEKEVTLADGSVVTFPVKVIKNPPKNPEDELLGCRSTASIR